MFNEVVLVKPAYYKAQGGEQTFDKNQKPNIFLQPIAGKIANKAMVMAGSVAESNGIINSDGSLPNGLQLIIVNETAPDATYGRQFSVSGLVQEVTDGREILNYRKELGNPTVVDVTDAVPESGEKAEAAKPVAINTSNVGPKAEEKKQ